MSAKWRALQHRHRYTYSAVIFSSSFIDFLNQSSLSKRSPKFYADLQELINLNSIYAQVNHAKKVGASFSELLTKSKEEEEKDVLLVSEAARLYLEILFLENSLPLHRTLVSILAKTRKFHFVVGGFFRELCDEYGALRDKGKRFCVSRVALSVMGMPKLGYLVDIIEDCANLVAWDIVFGMNAVLRETREWARPSPTVMEHCQDAMSCSYYLLQRFPAKFKDLVGEGENLLEMIMGILISVLKSVAFSRDCYVSAGVSFCAALQVCLDTEELGLVINEGIFKQTTSSVGSDAEINFKNSINRVPYKGDICIEINSFSVLSRLCLIRGILTAVPREILNTHYVVAKESLNGYDVAVNGVNSIKTILYDAILPELCSFCENPTDSHLNFHALTVMQICLQQIKTSMLSNLTNTHGNYVPISEVMGSRVLKIIWNNLDDPLSQTVKQVHLIFDLFLDIQSNLLQAEDSRGRKVFLQKIASDLLRLGPRCKGRYAPLASLTRRLGAITILNMNPSLLFETAHAYSEDDVCCATTSFLKCFLECLRDECRSSDGVEKGTSLYREHCLPPFLQGIASGRSKLRSNLNTYAIPVLLEVDVDSLFPLLALISIGQDGEEENRLLYPEIGCVNLELRVEQKVAVLVSLLKVSRLLALMEGDIELCIDCTSQPDGELRRGNTNLYAIVCIKGVKLRILVEWLLLALTHVDESLRVDAAESLFLNPKMTSLPSHLELTLMKEAVPLNMRSSSTGFQMKWSSLFRKFFARVRTALERQYKQGGWKPLVDRGNSDLNSSEETVARRAQSLFNFMRWLSYFLFSSCYPSAPYRRKIMAMELILIMTNVWSIVPTQDKCDSVSCESSLYPYDNGITSPDSSLLLVGSVVDSWDRLRENSFRILLQFPNPLPGISSEDMVQNLITWAKQLICSPRVRECDAGSLTLRLIFRKYVLDLGWIVRVSTDVACFRSQNKVVNGDYQISKSTHPVIEYIKSLIDWLNVAVEEGERDLFEACKNSFVHGVLLTLRYTFEELDWNSDVVFSNISEMRHTLEKLLELVMRITSLALSVVSADAWHMPEDMDEMVDDDSFMLDIQNEVDLPEPSSEHEDKNSTLVQSVRQSEQVIMVGCWLAMKEVSLLLGTIVRKIPLPSDICSDSSESEPPSSGASVMTISDAMLDVKQLEKIGNHFLEVLLKMKHNGAIDKTRAGFTALCNRLLCSNDSRLSKLTESWMEQLMERTVVKGQTVDDLLRRSAGIPAAFIALFLSEPEGAPKKLLPQALRWLIDVANRPLLDPIENHSATSERSQNEETTAPVLLSAKNPSDKASKIRDEGVIPTVHAFNVLRAAFNDTNLAADTSGFSAEALIVCVRSFSSPYWEVRNSACLAYTALVRRMVGFLNVLKRESARRALTGLEFFHRYPVLHPFLSEELKNATELLEVPRPLEFNLPNAVHPSLCPVLILLSRLKPSPIASEIGDYLDPFLFMPFIKRCSTQNNLRIRVLASRALTGLVSNENLSTVLISIASELPSLEKHNTVASFNLIHGILLLLGSLLDENCRNLVDCSKKDKILYDLINVLEPCAWIGSPKRCPCPILNEFFIKVLDHMLSIARTYSMNRNSYAIRNLLLELSTECLDIEASYGLSYYDPTIAELREQAALSYFSCVFQVSEEVAEGTVQMPPSYTSEVDSVFTGLQERLIRSLTDPSYEVRLTTLKWLLKFLRATCITDAIYDQSSQEVKLILNWANGSLQETLMKLLESEKNHRCEYYILRIFFNWNLMNFRKSSEGKLPKATYVGSMTYDSVLQLWDRLTSLYEITRHAKTRQTLLCCMAICVKIFSSLYSSCLLNDAEKTDAESKSDHLERNSRLYECISYFVNVVKQHSSSSETVNMREAAAESMIASGLLEQAVIIGSSVVSQQIVSNSSCLAQGDVNMYAYQILETWFTCIKLLEDEDDEIRQKLAVDVQKCFSSKSSNAESVPTQVEKVIELTFHHLSSVFGHWIEYFEYLAQWVLNTANYMVVPKGDLVRRVFDKEIDNHHEEKLLLIQLCCSHLERLPNSKSWAAESQSEDVVVANYLYNWKTKFQNQLIMFAKGHSGRIGAADWIGGVGNHKDAFLPLYGNLLGVYALSNCILSLGTEEMMPLQSDAELDGIIDPFLSNPLISNLYYSLVGRLRRQTVCLSTDQVMPTSKKGLIWDDFDPYFLLK